jgi:hypothetical protein
MTANTQQLARNVVAAFRAELTPAARNQIGEEGFKRLTVLIDEALQSELRGMATLLEEAVKKLRAKLDYPELGL